MLPRRILILWSNNLLVTLLLVCGVSPPVAGANQSYDELTRPAAPLTTEIKEADSRLNAIANRATELEKAERQVNPAPLIAPREGNPLSWPNYLGQVDRIACLSGSTELQHQIEDRLGKDPVYTKACQLTESLFVLLSERGANNDPLDVLDLTRQEGPIRLIWGLPWVERILKDKSGTLHIVVGGAKRHMGFHESAVWIYSTKTWERLDLSRTVGMNNGSDFLECPEKGDYGYETTDQVIEAKHRYGDQNGDGFEDIVIETVESSCATHKSSPSTMVLLATKNGFKEAVPLQPSKKSRMRPPRP